MSYASRIILRDVGVGLRDSRLRMRAHDAHRIRQLVQGRNEARRAEHSETGGESRAITSTLRCLVARTHARCSFAAIELGRTWSLEKGSAGVEGGGSRLVLELSNVSSCHLGSTALSQKLDADAFMYMYV